MHMCISMCIHKFSSPSFLAYGISLSSNLLVSAVKFLCNTIYFYSLISCFLLQFIMVKSLHYYPEFVFIYIHPYTSLAYGISLSSDLLASAVKFLCNIKCLFYSLIFCLFIAVYHGEMSTLETLSSP
jgi:hypothetical protein